MLKLLPGGYKRFTNQAGLHPEEKGSLSIDQFGTVATTRRVAVVRCETVESLHG